MDMTTGYWLAWCLGCRRDYEVPTGRRETVVVLAQAHTRKTGHGLWLKRLAGPPGEIHPVRRAFEPVAAGRHPVEERLRGGC